MHENDFMEEKKSVVHVRLFKLVLQVLHSFMQLQQRYCIATGILV